LYAGNPADGNWHGICGLHLEIIVVRFYHEAGCYADKGGIPEDIPMRLDLKENSIACI
jgi:hypothetical protein